MFPFIHLSDQFKIPTYILIISLTYCVAIFWSVKRAEKLKMDRNLNLDIGLCIMLGGFIGARLLHIVFEAPQYYLDYPERVFHFWQGGFVFYGGAIGATLSGIAFLKYHKKELKPWLDFFAPLGAFGYAIGRIGCFLNGCCFGKACALPWAVEFPGVNPIGVHRHPTQIYATLLELGTLVMLLYLEKNRHKFKAFKTTGQIFFFWIICHGFDRLIMEFFRDDFRGDNLLGLSISSLISFGLIFIGVWGFVSGRTKKLSL